MLNQLLSYLDNKKRVIGLVLVGIVVYVYVMNPLEVTVVGSGEVVVPTKSALIAFTLASTDANPTVTTSTLKAKAQTIKSLLTQQGIKASDISMSQLRLLPAAAISSGGTGYQGTLSMSAKTSNIGDVENLVAVLYQQGAVLVSQPILQVDEEEKLKQQALDKALKNAKDQAGAIGLKNWKFIRKVTAIAQTPTSSTSTIASGETNNNQSGQPANVDSFKINTVVSVGYRMW